MKKHLKLIVVFIVFVCSFGKTVCTAAEDDNHVYAAETEGTGKTGWVNENGHRRYYKNGRPVTAARVKIEDSLGRAYYYSFDKYGNQVYGLVKINGKYMYFDKKNKTHKGAAIKGWKTIGKKKYYFGKESCVAFRGFHTIDGVRYYFSKKDSALIKSRFIVVKGETYYINKDGSTFTGLKKIKGNYYYFNKKGAVVKKAWKVVNKKRYYFGYDGRAKKGFVHIDGKKYYFSKKNCALIKARFITVGGKRYYIGRYGYTLSGLIKKNGKYFYLRKSGEVVCNKWVTLDGKRYYFGESGRAYTGARKVNNSKYYYYFNKKGQLSAGTCNINGVHHRFGEDGKPYRGWWTSETNHKYYYKKDGTLNYKPLLLDGRIYVFSDDGFVIPYEGIVVIKGKTYYVREDGRPVTGYVGKDGEYYYFEKDGAMVKEEWRYADGYKFYFGKDGKRLNDVDDILGEQSSYAITVNKGTNVVTVFAKDGDNGYIIPVKAMICSTGYDTPTGTFYTPAKYRWLELIGPCWGQWDTVITGNFLFHSVYYNTENDNMNLSVSAYNKLGTQCSHGCVRLTAGDAKWLYDKCSLGTRVTIVNNNNEGPFPKPEAVKLPSWHTWDPTDPTAYYRCKQNGCH